MTNLDAPLTAGTTYRWDLVASTFEDHDITSGQVTGLPMWGHYKAAAKDTGHQAESAARGVAARHLGKTVHQVSVHNFTLRKN